MSKGPSGQTTTTTQQTNPLANAQLPYLEQLWQGAQNLAQPNQFTSGLQDYAGGQAAGTAPTAMNVMPSAIDQYGAQLARGIPAQSQADLLTANANDARYMGTQYGNALTGAAGAAQSLAPGWMDAFYNAGQQANAGLQDYARNATGALSGVGNYAMNTLPGMGQNALAALTGLAPGALSGMQNLSSGALSSLTGLAPGALSAGNPAEAGLYGNAGMALGNPALSSGLTGLASGRYIDPSTNPAYASMIQNATTPLVNQYMTATAPQGFGTSGAELAGRYGSGAQTNAQGQAQYGLGQALSNTISGITNNAYNTGLQATLGGGQALGGIYNQGVSNVTGALSNAGQLAQTGVQNAGNLLNQGYGTAGNLLNQGYSTAGNLINQGYTTGGNLINQGITGATNALSNAYQIGGNLANQGYTQQNAFMGNAASQGLGYINAGLSGLQAGSNAQQAGYGAANTALTGGGNLVNQGSTALTNALGQAGTFAGYPESQYTAAYNAPWLPLSNENTILGAPIGGTQSGSTSQPYYSNTGANILSGLTGAAGIASKILPLLGGI